MFVQKFWIGLFLLGLALTACGSTLPSPTPGKLEVVASTTLLGDVVKEISADLVDLTVLFPPNTDPHTFAPRPQDLAALSRAKLVILNGIGLEETLEPILDANVNGELVYASAGIPLLEMDEHVDEGEEGQEIHHDEESEEGHHHEQGDPHVWMDPNNVIIWTQNIAKALSEADPANAEAYQANAEAYITQLRDLDAWVQGQVTQIPEAQRKLVSDHLLFGYFARRYGFEQIGALIGSFSTNAQPSAQELTQLVDTIRAAQVPAIFVDMSASPTLAEQIGRETAVRVVRLYTGSLSSPGEAADSYIKFIRYNVEALVQALK